MTENSKTVRLENHEDGRFAFYEVHLIPAGEGVGWHVDCLYGRIGSAPQKTRKTKRPLTYSAAERVFLNAIHAKEKRGYSLIMNGQSLSSGSAANSSASGRKEKLFSPQLLNPVSLDEFKKHCRSGQFLVQEKHFGRRCGCRWKPSVGDKTPRFGNRKGEDTDGVSAVVMDAIAKLASLNKGFFELDGELMENRYVIFDVVSYKGVDIRTQAFGDRVSTLNELKADLNEVGVSAVIHVTETFEPWSGIDEMLDFYRGAEGLVLKRKSSAYVAGRPNSGGDQLKYKYYETTTVRVSRHNQKRSVGMEMLKGGEWVDVGNVTIAGNAEIPEVGNLIEVRYLHAYDGGSLYEPLFLMVRDDLDESACEYAGLKFYDDKAKPLAGPEDGGHRVQPSTVACGDARFQW